MKPWNAEHAAGRITRPLQRPRAFSCPESGRPAPAPILP
jgi:hypothetical protein